MTGSNTLTLSPIRLRSEDTAHFHHTNPAQVVLGTIEKQLSALAIAENNRTLSDPAEHMPLPCRPWWEKRRDGYVLVPRYGATPLFRDEAGKALGFEIGQPEDAFEAIRKALFEFRRRVKAGEWKVEIEAAQRSVSDRLKGKAGRPSKVTL